MGKGQGPAAAPENLGGTAIKPVGWDRTGLEAFKYLLYNPDTGEVLTRTPLSWLKITVFYIIYYSCLAAFWVGCLNIFFLTLPENQMGPKWTMDQSIIGTNPGVGLRPQNTDKLIDSQMFVLNAGDTNTRPTNEGRADEGQGDLNVDYAARLRTFLKVYDTPAEGDYQQFDLASLGDCGTFPYGFVKEGEKPVSPCIFVKFNKIWDWTPTPIDDDDLAELPQAVQDHYATQENKNNVWINCAGRYAADQEALDGGMEYFPKSRAIPAPFFPYTGGKELGGNNYHSPLVAIKITPNAAPGQLIHIECRAYFKNVIHNTKDKMGLVQFEVMINDN